jgi:hypothetical protein
MGDTGSETVVYENVSIFMIWDRLLSGFRRARVRQQTRSTVMGAQVRWPRIDRASCIIHSMSPGVGQ